MKAMTKEQLAEKINGNSYRDEISRELEKEAKESGLIVIFGASDDLLEFRGLIHDETGAYDGTKVLMAKKGDKFEWYDEELDEHITRTAKETRFYELDSDQDVSDKRNIVEAEWCPEGIINHNGKDYDSVSWLIKTDIPHATFCIMEDEDLYCRGIIIAEKDINYVTQPN